MKIALVHDYLVQYGGAERVLECFAEIFPYASIYTIVYDEEVMGEKFKDKRIKTSFLQKFYLARKKHRFFPFLMPIAIEQFDFTGYDVVLSDSSSYAKGIITRPETLHICYMHTPMRYAWDDCQKYAQDFSFPSIVKKFVPPIMNYVRVWDRVSSERVDKFIANSNFVAARIKKYYHKEAIVIYPPVAVNNFYIANSSDKFQKSHFKPESGYFLMVGRLIAYKRHDIAIQAFNKLGLRLKIIGCGPEMKRLRKMAKSNIEFLDKVDDEKLSDFYAECRAFIFPQEEDFGIAAIEAMASGKPIIAYRGGGIVEHVEEGKMGIFFEKQTAEEIVKAVKNFNDKDYDSDYIREKSKMFDREIFKDKIKQYIERELKLHKEKEDGSKTNY